MAMVEVKVPDIGDFKDVEVIEILVKPGDAVTLADGSRLEYLTANRVEATRFLRDCTRELLDAWLERATDAGQVARVAGRFALVAGGSLGPGARLGSALPGTAAVSALSMAGGSAARQVPTTTLRSCGEVTSTLSTPSRSSPETIGPASAGVASAFRTSAKRGSCAPLTMYCQR